ncbi:MAG: hypothetical protein WBI40_09505 [Methylococcaceae bacterium]
MYELFAFFSIETIAGGYLVYLFHSGYDHQPMRRKTRLIRKTNRAIRANPKPTLEN